MTPLMKRIARYGNGLATLFFTGLAVAALGHGALLIAGMWLLCGGLSAFNFRMFDKFSDVASEEARLQSELRAANLRRKLADLTAQTPETVSRHYGS